MTDLWASPEEYADDMGYVICPRCKTLFIPQPIENEGHECPLDDVGHHQVVRPQHS